MTSKQSFNRREFLTRSTLAAASLALLPGLQSRVLAADPVTKVNARVRGANEDIRVAVIGFNGRGMDHIKSLLATRGARIVALCDVDKKVLASGVKTLADKGVTVTPYQDIRKLLENGDIDAVSIATPNHWHSLAAIWAIQSGKDVYVEKPVSHNLWEGRQLVQAARNANKIVQTGTQCRSSIGLREGVEWLQAGNLGKIKLARGLCYKRRPSIGKTSGAQPTPASVDYDLWTGPAPMEPLRRAKLHYDWHWVWPTGNGDLGNQGIHQMDIARWILDEKELSPRVLSVGGRLGYEDDGETPNTLVVFHDYAKAPLLFEVRGLPTRSGAEAMDNFRGASVGVVVECEHGYVVNPSYTRMDIYDLQNKLVKSFNGGGDHFGNFIKAVRSRKPSDLHAEILEGHLSSALCHTGNISYQLGKQVQPEALREVLSGNEELGDTLGRMQEHLRANAVDLKKTPVTLGEVLTMDEEKFKGNEKANTLAKGTYREPYSFKL